MIERRRAKPSSTESRSHAVVSLYAAAMSEVLAAFKARSAAAGILLDFDGTLSEIAHLPSEARPYPGIPEILSRLTDIYRTVAIVSGRSAHELVAWLGPELDIWGVHGAERSRPKTADVVLSSAAARFADLMSRVLEEARRRVEALEMPGLLVEDKRVMVVLHYRAAQEPEQAQRALEELAADLAAEHDLWLASGRMAFELRPPVRLSKGDVVDALARERRLEAILFAGDDTVDLPGFDALDRLAEGGLVTLRVGVLSGEAPSELVDRADLTVDGPAGMVELLNRLL